jgi:hypothetical protein
VPHSLRLTPAQGEGERDTPSRLHKESETLPHAVACAPPSLTRSARGRHGRGIAGSRRSVSIRVLLRAASEEVST